MPNLKEGEKCGPTMTRMERRGQVCENSPKHCPTLLIPPPFILSDTNSLRGYLQSSIRLLCARHYSMNQGYNSEQNRYPCPHGADILGQGWGEKALRWQYAWKNVGETGNQCGCSRVSMGGEQEGARVGRWWEPHRVRDGGDRVGILDLTSSSSCIPCPPFELSFLDCTFNF